MQKIFKLLVAIISVFSVTGMFYYFQIRSINGGNISKQKGINYSQTPTVFIHGYQGNSFSFGPMLKILNDDQYAKRAMTITVAEDGQLTVKGNLSKKADNPTIMLLFSNNRASEIKQSQWISDAMQYLSKQGVKKVNLVAHSMGGVSALRYLLEYDQGPKVEKLVTVATPYNDLEIAEDTDEVFAAELTETGPSQETPIYQYFDQQMNKLPKNLQVLNIAGNKKDGTQSDGAVSLHSAFALRYLISSHVKSYQEYTITGIKASHSWITKTAAFEKELIKFLWQK